MQIIGISGKRGSGKSLLAKFLHDGYQYDETPFAAALKEMVRRDFKLTYEHTDGELKEKPTTFSRVQYKYEKSKVLNAKGQVEVHAIPFEYFFTSRDIMIAVGQFYRQFDSLYWVKKTFERINEAKHYVDALNRFVIPDVRFINEAEYIKSQGGKLVRLERDPKLNIYKTVVNDPSETELDDYKDFDMVIKKDKNKTPEDLQLVATNVQSLFKDNLKIV